MKTYEIVFSTSPTDANVIEADEHKFEGEFVELTKNGELVFIFPKYAMLSMEIKNALS